MCHQYRVAKDSAYMESAFNKKTKGSSKPPEKDQIEMAKVLAKSPLTEVAFQSLQLQSQVVSSIFSQNQNAMQGSVKTLKEWYNSTPEAFYALLAFTRSERYKTQNLPALLLKYNYALWSKSLNAYKTSFNPLLISSNGAASYALFPMV